MKTMKLTDKPAIVVMATVAGIAGIAAGCMLTIWFIVHILVKIASIIW